MSELSKQALLVDNNQSFPNNNAGAITPSVLRAFNTNMIDSTVNQTVFDAFSSSVESEIASMTGSVTSAITASSLITASFDNGTRNLTFTKGDSTTFNVNIPDVSGSSGDFVSTSSFNSYTASNDAKVNSLIAATGSYVTSAITASSLVTASVNLNTITFTKGDASTFNITVDTGSGGGSLPAGVLSSSVTNFVDYSASVDTRINNIVSGTGFATTGSNSFTGDQIITGSATISNILTIGSAQFPPTIQSLDSGTPLGQTSLQVNAGASGSFSLRTLYGAGIGKAILEAYNDFGIANTNSGKIEAKSQGGVDLRGVGGAIDLSGSSTIIQGVDFIAFSASLAGGGGGGTTYTNPTLNPYSGSLILVANTFTSSSFAHLSASAGNQVNLVFKNNNITADTIISGSNNIFTNPAAPTAGFKRYIGNNNIALGAGFPQISGSMQFSPTINNNYFIAGAPFMRGPISASLMQVNNNVMVGSITIGALANAVLNAEKLTNQTAVSNNFVAGQINLVANQSEIRALTNVTGNNVNGFVTLNLSSSAVIMSQNTINDGSFTFTNQFSSGAIGFGQVSIANNTIGGTGNTLFATGSQSVLSFAQAAFNQNLLLGSFNTAFVNSSESRISGTNVYHQMIATGLIGNRLIVTGSSNSNDSTSFGSTFVGRFNAADGIRDKSSDIVFAVGTGTTLSNRKTGFHIDSGSNSFFEGVVNISGSLLVNGIAPATVDTGSLVSTASFNAYTSSQALLNSGFATTASFNAYTSSQSLLNSGFATTGSNSFNGNQRITGSLTMSGSIITVDRSGNDSNVYLGLNALGMGFAGASPLASGNSISVAIGNGAMRFASGSSQNVAIGNNALANTIGGLNFALGSEAMSSNTTGTSNVAIGVNSLNSITTGNSNVSIGNNSGFRTNGNNNTYIGESAGYNITGSNNLILGRYQGSSGESFDNNIILADGNGNIQARYNGDWQFPDNVNVTGSITIQSGSGDLFVHGHKQFNVGAFQSNINQSGSANVSQSMQFEVTDLSYGVSVVSNSQITIANAGTYNIQFSTQLLANTGADDVYIWLKKNGTNVSATAGHVVLANNDELIAAWNYVIDAAANDYYEIAWQSTAGDAILLAEAATGNIPSIPSAILTVTQVR